MNQAASLVHRNLAPVDLAIIAVYFVIVFAIGFYFARKERTSTDYFLASRDVGWFFIGASLFVSNISTEHFIGLSGTGASSGLAVGHFEWLACLIQSEEHTSELQSRLHLVCRLLLEKKKKTAITTATSSKAYAASIDV